MDKILNGIYSVTTQPFSIEIHRIIPWVILYQTSLQRFWKSFEWHLFNPWADFNQASQDFSFDTPLLVVGYRIILISWVQYIAYDFGRGQFVK